MRDARVRSRLAIALVGCVALGLGSRKVRVGLPLWDENIGDALYASAVSLVLRLAFPALRPAAASGLAFGFSVAVELFQLTGYPARWSGLPLARLLLGTHFAWYDLICYGVGALLVFALDRLWIEPTPTTREQETGAPTPEIQG